MVTTIFSWSEMGIHPSLQSYTQEKATSNQKVSKTEGRKNAGLNTHLFMTGEDNDTPVAEGQDDEQDTSDDEDNARQQHPLSPRIANQSDPAFFS